MTRPSSSSRKRFDVFDFTEEDESVEKASHRFLTKYAKPNNPKTSPINKYNFLQLFAAGTAISPKGFRDEPIDVDAEAAQGTPKKEISVGVIDIDASDNDHQCPYSSSYSTAASLQVAATAAVKVEISGVDALLPSNSSDFENEPVDVGSDDDDDDDDSEMSSSSSSALSPAGIRVLLAERVSDHGSGGYEIDNVNMTVNLFPDFILYGDIYCTESQLTFSHSCIKLEGLVVNGLKETFSFDWGIGDVIKIESEWCGRVETAVVNLHLKSKGSKGAETANETSGIEQLKFAIYDPHWFKGEEAIKSLDVRYNDIWNVIFDTDMEREEDAFLGQNSMLYSERYFSDFDEPFEDVIYPKGDPDAVSISKRDIELLQPETFINDTIIDFYIKYLENKILPGEKHRFHFFNCFFFRKLADLDKDLSSACEGRAAFQRVRKWTRKVNLFEKDYIFIPVNYSLHWSLIVICHPGEVANFRDEEIETSPKVPCILHMDSIRGSHRGLKNLVQSYLREEWKERYGEMAEDVSLKFLRLRFVSLELPQQENSFDCGLFLLHYVEHFLEEAPINFSPFRLTKFSNFLSRNWFAPEEAYLKRSRIRKLILEILEDHSQKPPSVDCVGKCPPSQVIDANMQETEVELLEEKCISANLCHRYSSGSNEQGLGISLLAASPPRVVHHLGELGVVSRELFEPGTIARSFSDVNYQQMAARHQRRIMSPIEEDEETGEQIGESPVDVEDCQEVGVFASKFPTTSCSGKDFRPLETSWKQGLSMHLSKHDKENIFSGTSINGSQYYSSEAGHNDWQLRETGGFNQMEKTDKPESSSISVKELMLCVVEDSEESNSMHDGNESKRSPTFQEKIVTLSDQEADSIETINVEKNMPSCNEDPVSQSDEQHALKRLRLMPQGEREFTILSKELHL